MRPLSNIKSEKKSIVVKTDRGSILIRSISTAKRTATSIANTFTEHFVANFGIPSKILTDSAPQSTSKFFAALCKELGVKTVKKNEYHP